MQQVTVVWNRMSEAANKFADSWKIWSHSRFVRTFWEAWRWGVATIVRPVPILQRAAEEKPVLACLWLTLLQGLSLALGMRYAAESGGFVLSPITKLPSWSWVVFYALVFPPIIWFVKSAVLNLVAELLGGPPRGLSLLATTAVACSPLLLVLPIAFIAVKLSEPDLNKGFVGHLWFVFFWGVHVWWGVLTVVAVRETYRFSLSQAILALLLPFVVGLPLALIGYQILQTLS